MGLGGGRRVLRSRRLRRRSGLSRQGMRGGDESQQGEEECEKLQMTFQKDTYEPRPLRGFGEAAGLTAAGVLRWRMASYMTTAPATETLREETMPAMGMRSR